MEKKTSGKLHIIAEALTGAMAIPVEAAAKEVQKVKEKGVTKQIDKKRNESRGKALVALADAINDIEGLRKLNDQELFLDVSERILADLNSVKELLYQMTPSMMIQILTEQREKWENDTTADTDSETIAQQELVNKEIQRCRDTAVSSYSKAIDALKKQADAEEPGIDEA